MLLDPWGEKSWPRLERVIRCPAPSPFSLGPLAVGRHWAKLSPGAQHRQQPAPCQRSFPGKILSI